VQPSASLLLSVKRAFALSAQTYLILLNYHLITNYTNSLFRSTFCYSSLSLSLEAY
jgi:hypothetical protein